MFTLTGCETERTDQEQSKTMSTWITVYSTSFVGQDERVY